MCQGDRDTGGALMALGSAELGAAIVAGTQIKPPEGRDLVEDPRVAVPLLLFQDTWIIGVVDPYLRESMAERAPFTPQDTLGELVAAPFNIQVLKRPSVWGALAVTAAALGIVVAVDGGTDWSAERNVLSWDLRPGPAFAAAGGTYAVLFSHVAIAEEQLFRGVIQSSLERSCGRRCGWLTGSLIFGVAHAPNALAYETSEERKDYLLTALPIVTAIGAYMGAAYQMNDHSLAPPVALHFWYDFLLSMAQFAVSPEDAPISATWTLSF